MCGRYNIITDADALIEFFDIAILDIDPEELRPNYNVAPSQNVPVIRGTEAGRELSLLRWGLIPFWAKEPKIGYKMINARAETVATKPAFRAAFKSRRCLIPATGFYEWKQEEKTKKPYNICLKDQGLFSFAGLWEHWEGEDETIESCTVIVTQADKQVSAIHDRMPVILQREDYDAWIDPEQHDLDKLTALLKPKVKLTTYPVSTRVNSPRNNDAACVEPI